MPKILSKIIFLVIAVTVLSGTLILLTSSSMQMPLSSDEHQFITSAKLMVDENALPYKDYPYFHMPYLVYIYAFLFRFTDHLLLSSRLVTVISSWLLLLTIFFVSFNQIKKYGYTKALMAAVSIVFIMVNNPLFLLANSHAWNHALPILLCVWAFHLCCRCNYHSSRWWEIFLAGFLVGMALSIRLTFALLPLGFLMAIYLYTGEKRKKIKVVLMVSFLTGLLLSINPVLYIWSISKDAFVFGNLGYAQFNTMYRIETAWPQAMTFAGKFSFLKNQIFSTIGNLLVLLAFLFFTISALMAKSFKREDGFEINFALLLMPLLYIGSFAPTPSWKQYYYAPIPFMILGVIYGVRFFLERRAKSNDTIVFLFLLAFFCHFNGPFGVKNVSMYVHNFKSKENWIPSKVHNEGVRIANLVDKGKVLTIAPIHPQEGGAKIYKEFATGHGTWRTGKFLSAKLMEKYHFIYEGNFEEFLENDPPAGILVGFSPVYERAFIDYARLKRYKSKKITDQYTLWIKEDLE